jgi:hypothetical protein
LGVQRTSQPYPSTFYEFTPWHSLRNLSDEQISEMLTYLSEQMGKDAKVINAEATDIASDGQEE